MTAPPARGSTFGLEKKLVPGLDHPARAGINLAEPQEWGLPRTRGDQPTVFAKHGRAEMNAPHARGSTG